MPLQKGGETPINMVLPTPFPFPQNFQIKYVRCTPGGAPATPSCAPAVLVHNETQPLPFGGVLGVQDFRIATYPKHDHNCSEEALFCLQVLHQGFSCQPEEPGAAEVHHYSSVEQRIADRVWRTDPVVENANHLRTRA